MVENEEKTSSVIPPKDYRRPDNDRYFMDIAHLVSRRSTCLRRHVGAIVVKEKRILSTGYNGAPKGVRHCAETGCLRDEMKVPSGQRHELCRGLHAEQNAIIQAAVFGVSIRDATMYCTFSPCIICAKMIINAGITELVFAEGYPDDLAQTMLDEAGITVRTVKK